MGKDGKLFPPTARKPIIDSVFIKISFNNDKFQKMAMMPVYYALERWAQRSI